MEGRDGAGTDAFSHPVQAASSTVRTFSSRWIASGGHNGKQRPDGRTPPGPPQQLCGRHATMAKG